MRTEKYKKRRKLRRMIMFLIGLLLIILFFIGFLIFQQLEVEKTTEVISVEDAEELSENEYPTEHEKPIEEEYVDQPPEEEVEVEIVFAGDTMFDWDLKPLLEQTGYDYPFTYIKDTVQNADYSFINAETVFTENPMTKDPDQIFWINSDLKALEALETAGFKMINIGNNHTLDYREAGLIDTIENLEKTNMEWIGAGRNQEEAYQSKVVEIKGKKFRFFTFIRFFPNTNWVATDDKPGVPNGYDLNLVKQTIEEQKGDEDYTIVYFHWGIEKTNTPAEYQLEYVETLKNLGVDLIVGSHPHWLQGFGYYDGIAVAYSLGNFLFPPYVEGRTAETGLLKASFIGEQVHLAFEPYIIHKGKIIPAEDDLKQEMLEYLQSISFDVAIDDDGKIHDLLAVTASTSDINENLREHHYK